MILVHAFLFVKLLFQITDFDNIQIDILTVWVVKLVSFYFLIIIVGELRHVWAISVDIVIWLVASNIADFLYLSYFLAIFPFIISLIFNLFDIWNYMLATNLVL